MPVFLHVVELIATDITPVLRSPQYSGIKKDAVPPAVFERRGNELEKTAYLGIHVPIATRSIP